jgi:hypothetical protein
LVRINFASRRRTHARPFLLSSLAAALAACAESPTEPPLSTPRQAPAPNFDVTSVSLPVPASNAPPGYGVLQPIATGYRLLPGEWARIRVRGQLQMQENPQCTGVEEWEPVSPSGAFGGYLSVDASRRFECHAEPRRPGKLRFRPGSGRRRVDYLPGERVRGPVGVPLGGANPIPAGGVSAPE